MRVIYGRPCFEPITIIGKKEQTSVGVIRLAVRNITGLQVEKCLVLYLTVSRVSIFSTCIRKYACDGSDDGQNEKNVFYMADVEYLMFRMPVIEI